MGQKRVDGVDSIKKKALDSRRTKTALIFSTMVNAQLSWVASIKDPDSPKLGRKLHQNDYNFPWNSRPVAHYEHSWAGKSSITNDGIFENDSELKYHNSILFSKLIVIFAKAPIYHLI
jgi:hypothetical protein